MAHKRYNFYTVVYGVECGIFDDWKRCKMQVDHYKGNSYKGFYSLIEAVTFAEEYMQSNAVICVELQGNRIEVMVKDLKRMLCCNC